MAHARYYRRLSRLEIAGRFPSASVHGRSRCRTDPITTKPPARSPTNSPASAMPSYGIVAPSASPRHGSERNSNARASASHTEPSTHAALRRDDSPIMANTVAPQLDQADNPAGSLHLTCTAARNDWPRVGRFHDGTSHQPRLNTDAEYTTASAPPCHHYRTVLLCGGSPYTGLGVSETNDDDLAVTIHAKPILRLLYLEPSHFDKRSKGGIHILPPVFLRNMLPTMRDVEGQNLDPFDTFKR